MLRHRFSSVAVGVLVWLIAVGIGFTSLWRFSYTPGPAANNPSAWPSTLVRNGSRPTLVMALHPECGCSTASIGELARIVAQARTPLDVLVLFNTEGDVEGLEQGVLWRGAAAISGVTPLVDRNGVETRRFGAYVSGQTFLFDRQGYLIFSGGITAARAHGGDNDGATAVLQALATGRAPITTTPVFGCLLFQRIES